MSVMPICGFRQAWIGPCKEVVQAEGERCEEHAGKRCSNCNQPATGNCDETMGSFVCGAGLCDNCEHTICSNGCSSGGHLPKGYGSHCTKGSQKYKVWYEDSAERYNKKVYEEDWPDGRKCTSCQKLLGPEKTWDFCSQACFNKTYPIPSDPL